MKKIGRFFITLVLATIYDFVPLLMLIFFASKIVDFLSVDILYVRKTAILLASMLYLYTFFSIMEKDSIKAIETKEIILKKRYEEKEAESNAHWKAKEDEYTIQQQHFQQWFTKLNEREKRIRGQLDSLDQREKNLNQEIDAATTKRVCIMVRSSPLYSHFFGTAVFNEFRKISPIDANQRLLAAGSERAAIRYPLSVAANIQGKDSVYRVTLNSCTCPDYQFRHTPCKHMYRLALDVGLLSSVSKDDIEIAFSRLADERMALQTAQKQLEQKQKKSFRTIEKHLKA